MAFTAMASFLRSSSGIFVCALLLSVFSYPCYALGANLSSGGLIAAANKSSNGENVPASLPENRVSFLNSLSLELTPPSVDSDSIDDTAGTSYDVSGRVKGLVPGKNLTVFLGALYGNYFEKLDKVEVNAASPEFNFNTKAGKYYIKIQGSGYYFPGSQPINVPCRYRRCPFLNNSNDDILEVQSAKESISKYVYIWKLRKTMQFGDEMLNKIPEPLDLKADDTLEVESGGDPGASAAKLAYKFGIYLEGDWGSGYADRLLSIFDKLKSAFDNTLYKDNAKTRPTQIWSLTDNENLDKDVQVTVVDGLDGGQQLKQRVKIFSGAFKYSKKKRLPAKKNSFYYSRRLMKAVIAAMCRNSRENMEKLFEKRHGVRIFDPKTNGDLVRKLSGYPSSHYQDWLLHKEELIEILASWNEYPTGFSHITGLRYLLRRKDGTTHPQYPSAAAVAYPASHEESFIEFMEKAFQNNSQVSKLILHELAHFIHYRMVPKALHQPWRDIGGWFEDPADPEGWSTHQQTQFVSAYGHGKGPGEDFAESVSYYVLNPKKLLSRAPLKHKWIKENVMEGNHYQLVGSKNFEVLNLDDPDFIYPGRIRKIFIKVMGMPEKEKTVVLRIHLYRSSKFSCAKHAYFRLSSDIGTFFDKYVYSNDSSGCGHIMHTSFKLPATYRRGVWTTDQIRITDGQGLERYVGLADFGFRLWLNNEEEDVLGPSILLNSIHIRAIPQNDGGSIIRTSLLVKENKDLRTQRTRCYFAREGGISYSFENEELQHNALPEVGLSSAKNFHNERWQGYRKVPTSLCFNHAMTELEKKAKWVCYQLAFHTVLSKFVPGGQFTLRSLNITDTALNATVKRFYEQNHTVAIRGTSYADWQPPTIHRMSISAESMNPAKPDGSTRVHVTVDLSDNAAGVHHGRFNLIDPNGTEHTGYLREPDHSSESSQSDQRDPRKSQKWERVMTLPKGSAPGTWLLSECFVADKAGNTIVARYAESILVESE